ncbi:hypothetical protein R1flu_007443 [Riccia fluitans]|uniref:HTH CENPB-type domain-containing protein n=1 Tax=Riccia fluitans TaxID=41844 RepID=A0ABD1Z1J7_9MARC
MFRLSLGRFTKLEDMLYIWIDSMRHANLPVPPSLAIAKVKSIAVNLSIPETDFKASWQWLSRFRQRRGLQKMLLHGEGAEVNKTDPQLLAALDELYATIAHYEPENIYNMDETGLFSISCKALKKRFKYLYLKDVLDFYQLDDEAKICKKEQGRRLRWGAAGAAYGNPAHLLDAANYVNEAWQSVSRMSIKNAFIKADIMPLDEDEELVTKVVQALSALNLSFVQDKLEEFVHIDDENSEKFAAAVLEDVEHLFQMMKVSE